MKTLFLLILFNCSILCVAGQNKDGIIVKKNSKGIVEYAKFTSPQSNELKQVAIPEDANEFFAEYLKPTASTSFILQPQKQRNKDFRHEHYDQYYNGVKVDGAGYNLHYEKGKMYLAHGNFIQIEDLTTKPSITDEAAHEAFARYKGIPVVEVIESKIELLIKEIPAFSSTDTFYSPVLVFKVYLITGHSNNNEIGYIDAQSGKVLMTEPSMTGYSATGRFETRYNGTRQATTQYYNGTFNLCDSSRNTVIHTWNIDGSTNINNRDELTDANNNWTANEYASSEDDMGLDIHWTLQEIYDYFENEYGINSFDNPATGNGHNIDAYFHYGEQDNAFWDLALNVLKFGDGNSIFRSVASLDAVAHEFGHGITDFQIGWAYGGDLQIFHEGLSDIWGAILENRISPNSIWEIGEDVILNYNCLRNMQNPQDPNADTEISDTYLSSIYNLGNQYVKSGVFTHWFYLLVNGGSGINDNGNSYSVHGIGMDAAEKLVVESVFNNYLDNQSTYPGIRTQTVNAAESSALFGENSIQSLQVENAWYAVGVGSQPTQTYLSGPSIVCSSGAQFTISNLPPVDSIIWSCGPYLTVYSGQNTNSSIIKATSNGNSWVQARLVNACGSITLPRKEIWAGTPTPEIIDIINIGPNYPGGNQICANRPNDGIINWNPLGGILEYDWQAGNWQVVQHPMDPFPDIPKQNVQLTAPYYGYDNPVSVTIRARNQCGWGNYLAPAIILNGISCGGYYLVASPNPAGSYVELTLIPEADVSEVAGKTKIEQTSSNNGFGNYQIQLWSEQGGLLKTAQSDQLKLSLPVRDLAEGKYYLHLLKDGNIYKQQLLIQR